MISDTATHALRVIIRSDLGTSDMQDYEFRHMEHARVRSADAAVYKAVQHEAALERKAVRRAQPKHLASSSKRVRHVDESQLYGIKKRHKGLVPLIVLLFFVLILGGLAFGAFYVYEQDTALIVRERTIEAGEQADIGMYITGTPVFQDYVSCNLDFSTINNVLPQTIRFTVRMYGTNFPCVLNIVDTTPPVAEAVPQVMYSVDRIPQAEDCVTNVYDLNDVTVEWAEVPNMEWGGDFTAKVLVKDSSGNETLVSVPFSVTRDIVAPVIEGAEDIEAFIGDTIQYRENVTVTDDIDPEPVLEVDTSGIVPDEEGTYEVTYRAKDFSGNMSETTINLTLVEKPDTWVEPELVYAEAREVLNKITNSSMTDMEVAIQITWWVRYNVHYISECDDSCWTRAAYDGLTKRTGNCYTFAMCAKALFDVAGIENMIIIRDPYIYNPHFWNYINIDGQWYHCDSTPRLEYDGYFFMYTTEELRNFWHNGWNGYNFDEDLYPESAQESVQNRINYVGHSIKN